MFAKINRRHRKIVDLHYVYGMECIWHVYGMYMEWNVYGMYMAWNVYGMYMAWNENMQESLEN